MTALLDATIQTSAILGLALAATGLLLRRRTAAVRHAVLAAAILTAIATPLLATITPSWTIRPEARIPAQVQPATAAGSADARDVAAGGPSISFEPARLGPLVRSVWLGGIGTGIVVLVVGLVRVRRMARRSVPVAGGHWARLLDELAPTRRIARSVRLLQSASPALLVTWGVVRPRIVLPAGASEWSEDRVRVVLAHELAHIHRRDWLMQVVSEIFRSVHWFNPLAWAVCSQLRQESEKACDDAVLGLGVPAPDYAAHLVHLAQAFRHASSTAVTALQMAHPSTLERRIAAMLSSHSSHGVVTRRALACTAVACLAVAIPVAGLQVFAQSGSGRLSGMVSDPTGGALPGVVVTLSNAKGRIQDRAITDGGGSFEIPALPAGTYDLEASLAGFRTRRASLTLDGGEHARLNVSLLVGTVTETLRVTATSAAAAPRPARGTQPIRVGGNIKPPAVVRKVAAVYPEHLRVAGVEGTVNMEGTIDPNGTLSSVRVLNEQVHDDLVAAATEAVGQWEWTPALLNGQPTAVIVNLVVQFRLSPQ